MQELFFTIITIVAILSSLFYVIRHPYVKEGSQYVKNIVAVAIGVMLTVLATHLLPEVFGGESGTEMNGYIFLFSLIVFYIIGWISHGHEHHDEHDNHKHKNIEPAGSGVIMYLGQSIHSVADGVVIASSFTISPIVGLITSLAITMHHIPMMSGILARGAAVSNANHKRLTIFTILSSCFMFVGAGLFYSLHLNDVSSVLLAVSAASFLYVGAYDLTSYLREYDDRKIYKRVVFLFLGVFIGLASQMISHNVEHENDYLNHNTVTKTEIADIKEVDSTENSLLKARVEYPGNNPEVKSWMQGVFLDFASSSVRELNEYDKNAYEWLATYTLATSTDYKTYVYNVYNYTGGAHGSTSIMPHITDLKTGKRIINLAQIYNEEVYTYLSEIASTEIKNQLTNKGAAEMIDEKWINDGVLATSSNYTVFWFEGYDLIIHFGQYQVAPYAAGMFEVRVPLKEIEKYKR